MEGFRARQSGTMADRLLEMSGSLTVCFAGEIVEALASALEGAERVRFDAAEVNKVDLIGLQLICAAHRTALRDNILFSTSGLRDGIAGRLGNMTGFSRHPGCLCETGPCPLMAGEGAATGEISVPGSSNPQAPLSSH